MPKKRERLDNLLVLKGLAESRAKAQRLIYAGTVSIDGQKSDKPGRMVDTASQVQVAAGDRFVSRGGGKLLGAFEYFPLTADGKICLDVGASTGGFTDCLLQHGAALVMALDVGTGQLHARLRADRRVVIMEKFNVRYLQPSDLEHVPELVTVDVSFISLTLVLGPLNNVLQAGGQIVTLIKPQFEAGRDQVERGGVVRNPEVHAAVLDRIRAFGEQAGLRWKGVCPAPITGPAGNREFLALWEKQSKPSA